MRGMGGGAASVALGVALGLGAGPFVADAVLAQARTVIVQKGLAFGPATTRVQVGGQVVFRNEDPFGHNVYSPSQGGIFDIGLQPPDTETPVTFARAGEYVIQCRIHPRMRASVIVGP